MSASNLFAEVMREKHRVCKATKESTHNREKKPCQATKRDGDNDTFHSLYYMTNQLSSKITIGGPNILCWIGNQKESTDPQD